MTNQEKIALQPLLEEIRNPSEDVTSRRNPEFLEKVRLLSLFINELSTEELNKFKPVVTIKSKLEKANLLEFYGKEIIIENALIKIPLPDCNTTWTFAAFKVCEEICNTLTRAYPSHHSDVKRDYSKFIYIEVGQI